MNQTSKSSRLDPLPATRTAIAACALVCTLAGQGRAQDAPAPKPAAAPGTLNRFFNGTLPDAIGKSKINLSSRLRYEYADADAPGGGSGPEDGNALTLRTRFGITSGKFHGFQAMIEGENILSINPDHDYNAAGSNKQPGRTIIPDPETTELNQAWLAYSNTNWMTTVKGGRQRIVLDNHRFVGDVGWRQNQQTFDAVMIENTSLKNFTAFYAYLWDVNRVFGDVSSLPAANQDFDSDSHVVNLSYSGWKYAKIVGYAYVLDLENDAAATRLNSTATYGGYLAGGASLSDKVKINYRAEFAWQTDYAKNPIDYGTEYYNFEAGLDIKPIQFGLGYESLSSDNGTGFKTPLATLHAFNGWADLFLATPAAGLRDAYGYVQATLPWDMPLRVVYHKFDADTGGADFGQEVDVVLSKKLGKYWSAMLKYSHYDGEDAPYGDVDKFWAQVEFNF